MIFVTVGTQPNGFLRCLRAVESLVAAGVIQEEVVAQIGNSDFSTSSFKTFRFVGENDFRKYISEASAVITHAGSGAIFNAIKAGKKVIAMARLHDFNEMADNHQTELVRKLAEEGYILDGTYSLEEAWKKLPAFEPRANDFTCSIIPVLETWIDAWMKE